jgi:capsule polysaccharide modification protein KpsS
MVLLITNYGCHLGNWLRNFQKFLEASGSEVVNVVGKKVASHYDELIRRDDCRHVFMWNGEESNHAVIKRLCSDCGVPYSILEVGFFPQKQFYIIDKKGINANSSIMEKRLQVSEEDLASYEAFREMYLAGRTWRRTNKYILAPLQLGKDTNIKLHSPFKSMQHFIGHVEAEFPGKKIIFKRHPLDKGVYKVAGGNEFIVGGNILDIAQDAEMVYGINSTSLLETAMLGVPTTAVGNGFLKAHGDDIRTLLAYLCKMQVPVSATDLTRWLAPLPDGNFKIVE